MIENDPTPLLVLAGVALSVLGGLIGSVIAARSQKSVGSIAASAAIHASKETAEQQMIDQLQEELERYRRATDQRLDRLEDENRAYREFIFVQRDHMTEAGIIPPPWPAQLPR
jgi:parvulin-like peptidyl-prolyl isomerase